MSSILDIIEAISTRLPQSVNVQIGPEYISSTSALPRVVWVATDDIFVAPPNRNARARRAIHTAHSTWQALIYVAANKKAPLDSFRALEQLRDQLLGAIFDECRGNATVLSGHFEQQDSAAILHHGRTYSLQVQFAIEVLASGMSARALAPIEDRIVRGDFTAAIEVNHGNS